MLQSDFVSNEQAYLITAHLEAFSEPVDASQEDIARKHVHEVNAAAGLAVTNPSIESQLDSLGVRHTPTAK